MTKTKKRATLAETVSFAHLLPLNPGASARAEDDDDKDKGPDAEDGETEDDDKKPAGKKAKKARADDQGNDDGEDDGADGDGEDADADDGEDNDGEGDDDKKPSGKKAKKARADDKDSDGEDDEKEDGPSARAGAMRERRRCAAIFGSRHASGRPDLAAHLAFNTNMSAAEAIGTMKTLVGGEKAGARSARSTLADRMQSESVPNPGQGASAPTGPKGLAAAMIAASKKAQGG